MEKKDKHPLVSVIMATYNIPGTYLSQAIDSILNQTYQKLELLIADDSTDNDVIDVINNYAQKDKRVIVIRKNHRMGVAGARNEALLMAKGELIMLMDADDISLEDRIQKQVDFAQEHEDIDLFGGHIYIIDANNKITSIRKYKTDKAKFIRMFAYRNPIAHPTIMFRRIIIDNNILYDTDFKQAEDIEFYLRLFNKGYHLGIMDEFLLKYRIIGDMQMKRKDANWKYNHKARSKNFNWNKPIFSITSWFTSLAYMYIPDGLFSLLYKRENNKLR